MELAIASIFIFFIILILWEIKADFVLIIFGFAAYIFLLFYAASDDPLARLLALLDFLLLNPLSIFVILGPLIIIRLYKFLNKNRKDKLNN
ncbi:MAG: hypothetical protein ACFFCE_13665 [Promethearchaeota archaeon]